MKKITLSIEKIKHVFLGIFKIPFWLDLQRVKAGALYLKKGIINLFVLKKEKKPESFKEAKTQFNLSDKELLIKQKALFRLSMLMLLVGVAVLCYSVYLLLYGSYHSTVLSLVVMGIALVLAFRYHFWYFQIKHKKLGCTFQEWYRAFKR